MPAAKTLPKPAATCAAPLGETELELDVGEEFEVDAGEELKLVVGEELLLLDLSPVEATDIGDVAGEDVTTMVTAEDVAGVGA